ncbi:MAG: DnaJ C-terminal domain-containing protein [Halothiobacillaceae bacterium]
MEYRDYYAILGVERDATQEQIKAAYRRLARKYHPDVSSEPDAEARFKELGEAYEVLKDPEKRAAYDQLGRDWQAGQDFRPPPDWSGGFEFHGGGFTDADAAQFSDFFESLFGRGPGRARAQARGEDVHARVRIALEDAYHGASRTLSFPVSEPGPDGRLHSRQRTLQVRIPRGIRQGQHIRLAGQGSAGLGGGPPGDLYLEVAFLPHAHFHVDGADVFMDLPLAPWEAALGAGIALQTPSGRVEVKVPAGSKSGRKLRLKGRGIPARVPGDLYVVLQISLPPAQTPQEEAAYRALAQAFPHFDPRADMGGDRS